MQWQEFRSHIRHLPARDMGRIERAFVLGKKMHEGQKRRSGEPYFNHPIAVAHMLSDLGADADTLIAALLHDTVEDTTLTILEIDRQFGGSVSALIDGVTKLSSKDVAMSPKLDEQRETLRKIFKLMELDVRIMVIKLVDRLHNMQTIEFLPPDRQKLLANETQEVFVKIADKLCMQDLRDELEGLCLSVLEPETYAKLLEARTSNEQRCATLIDQMKAGLRGHDRHLASRIDLVFEPKMWDQLRAQLNVGGSVATGVSFLTVAFVVDDIDAAYRTLGALHQLWKREVLSFQDFINAPQLNGYRGLHTTVIMQDGTRVRCKIRTRDMHSYARVGVATLCFKGMPDIADILPWTQRISPLTADTEGSSNDFWESLKGDILGESIIIHGPDDSTVQLPHEATALDGAFYLLQDGALFVKSIKVNGVEVALGTPLTNAASVEVTLSGHETVSREWLRMAQTGFAAAKIRSSLSKLSESEKLQVGRDMLQQVFTQQKRGFIEEFNEDRLKEPLAVLGLQSLKDVYISIADGRLEPGDVYNSLFNKPHKLQNGKAPKSVIRYTADMDSVELMDRLNLVHRLHGSQLLDIRYRRQKNKDSLISLIVRMPSHMRSLFVQALKTAGADHLSEKQIPGKYHILAISVLILLWGLDPVLSKMMLTMNVEPFAFTFIRAWSVSLFGILLLLAMKRGNTLVRIPLHYPSLWIAGISLFLVNVLTYWFLSDGSPLLYNTILRGNAVILALPLLIHRRLFSPFIFISLMGIVGFAIIFAGPFDITSLFIAMGILAFFSMYTKATARFQSVARIQARYAQLFTATSLIAALGACGLLGNFTFPSTSYIVIVAVYSIIFVGVPYVIFHAITENFGYETLSPWINVTVLVTFIGQILLLHDITGFDYLIPAAILLSGASLMASTAKRLASN